MPMHNYSIGRTHALDFKQQYKANFSKLDENSLMFYNFKYVHNSDISLHIESACQLHGAKMTRHGLVHKVFASAD